MKVHLTTLGCPKNQVDSELMLGMLTAAGFPLADRPEDAECLIVNTCAFIDRAREESVQTILELAQLKARGRCRSLIVTGCLTQRYGSEVMKEMPEVDAILGTSGLERIVELVGQAANRLDWATSAPPGYLYDAATPRLTSARVPYAYVKIAEGCDMGCTFCAIPQFRGRHRSRPLRDIVAEVEGLAGRGIQEAILVSQDTLAYGRDLPGNGDIGDLLLALGDTRMPWIRPMYLHPAHVSDRLLAKWRRARIVPYLDLPVQHGDDGILKSMRRAVTARRMREVVAAFRDAVPGLTVRTTILVGFPGETEAAFHNLLAFIEDVAFDRLGVFTYSPEEGTPSPDFPDQVPAEVAAERATVVQEAQDRIGWERARALLDTVQEVLVDGPSVDSAFEWEGRTAGQAPEIDGLVYLRGRFEPGRFARVRIVEVEGYELVGERA
ncbi:MAG TPA: 30S ribosomal protein S12 methylthiotransferase RimO [Methylomirabilota bacterium]|jgi:ribosomal protein S12 methylthiotransferase|nr:30S ribosomal protein S12 methylthiotransferase RimO [Methylomirabilota bacterium]